VIILSRKTIYLSGVIIIVIILFFISRKIFSPAPLYYQGDASWAASQKLALIRLEDVNPGTYDTREKLDKLVKIADYLYKEGVPFQISLIPVYKDPANNVEISIGDTDIFQVRDFNKTIMYMRERGGMVGLHGYTHQYLAEVSGSGFEFMDKGSQEFARPAYAEERVKKALGAMDRAGIPVDYWETPHYTASLDQYKVLGNYFGLIYDPNPWEKKLKNVSSRDSTGMDNQSVIFVPAPLFNIEADKDVGRILSQLDKKDPVVLASFFYHPTQEFKYLYKMQTAKGKEFYAYEPDSYLKRLINGFKERGYKFVSVYDLIGFLPAERVTGISTGKGKVLLTGDVDGDGRSDFIAGDPTAGNWQVSVSRVDRSLPRNNPASFTQAGDWLVNWGQGGDKDFAAGDFNNDGKKDLVSWDKKTGEMQVALSDGSKFIPQQQPWGYFSVPQGTVKIFAGRYNNSSKDGLLFWVQDENTAYVVLSDADSFSQAKPWLQDWGEGAGSQVLTGDINGDGKKDLAALNKNTGAIQVALNDGDKFEPTGNSGGQPWITGFVTGDRWQVLTGDFTGEGADDFIAYDKVIGKWEFILSRDKQFVIESWPVVFGKDPGGQALVGDFNGDKKIDLAVSRQFAGGQTPIDLAVSVMNRKNSP
jgi:predicted deacetylase